ncbi:hypothetical protein Hanom_Chr05g00405701 [Helianthus anomalus]
MGIYLSKNDPQCHPLRLLFRKASPIELALGVKACLKVATDFQVRWFNSRLDKGSCYFPRWEESK